MPVPQEQIEDEGFLALLKPIQELTRNGDVDLSLHLGEYLNYIRQICGDNLAEMNFAQAAVLLQNSASIYCKKVEILHKAVNDLNDELCKKQAEANKKNQGEGGPAAGRRRRAIGLDTDEFLPFEDICSDRPITICLEKERQNTSEIKKQKIVLNAATKVKAKDKTSCNMYNYKHENMGKKEEFRLNWRVCSTGTLHEEFINKKSVFQKMNPLNITAKDEPTDNSCHDFGDDHPPASEPDLPPPSDDLPDLGTSFLDIIPKDIRESDAEIVAQVTTNPRVEEIPQLDPSKSTAYTVEANDVKKTIENPWEANDDKTSLVEKPIKKRIVIKIPPDLNNEKKRKGFDTFTGMLLRSYSVVAALTKHYNITSFLRDPDFGYQSKLVARRKRNLMTNHRAKYQGYMETEAAKDHEGEFPGFYNEEADTVSEPDLQGFEFEDGGEPDFEVPLPDPNNILTGDKENSHWMQEENQELRHTLMAYAAQREARKHNDHNFKTDLAKRVEEWHQKIAPKLEAAEERSSFDIHGYGTRIIDTFNGEIGSQKQFADIVAGQSREEVARYFLASLVLANTYNVEISESETGDLNKDCVQLRLLSLTRHHEEMDDNIRQTSNK